MNDGIEDQPMGKIAEIVCVIIGLVFYACAALAVLFVVYGFIGHLLEKSPAQVTQGANLGYPTEYSPPPTNRAADNLYFMEK